MRALLVLLVGCGSSRLAVRMGEPSRTGEHDDTIVLAKCAPTKHVTVADPSGTPVAGAIVYVRLQEHTNCPSVGPAAPIYTTAAARTNKHGVATTCDPETFFRDEDLICPHHRDPATIVVIAGDREAKLSPPFAGDLRVVLPQR